MNIFAYSVFYVKKIVENPRVAKSSVNKYWKQNNFIVNLLTNNNSSVESHHEPPFNSAIHNLSF